MRGDGLRLPALSALCLAALGCEPAAAHPHVFVDTTLTLSFGAGGRLGEIGVVWAFDDLTSMLIVEDQGLDADGDGTLTGDELAHLRAFVPNWPAEYYADLHLSRAGQPVPLAAPADLSVDLQAGRLVATYRRPLPEGADPTGEGLLLQVYDPSYYTFYDLAGPPQVTGRDGCQVHIDRPDLAAAQRLYETALAGLTEDEILSQGKFPEVGGAFADRVRLTCAD